MSSPIRPKDSARPARRRLFRAVAAGLLALLAPLLGRRAEGAPGGAGRPLPEMPSTDPQRIEACQGVYSWTGHEDLIHVRDADRGEIIESYVGVPDRDLDALLGYVAGGVVLPEGDDPYDLVVTRGETVVGRVHRRPGRPSTSDHVR